MKSSSLDWKPAATATLEQEARQAALNLPDEWQELVAFLIEHWGCFASTVAILPDLSSKEHALAQRRLELNGTMVYFEELTSSMTEDFHQWLNNWLPTVMGPGKDIARIALVLRNPSNLHFKEEGARRETLARQFPIPLIFAFSSQDPWQEWLEQHRFLIHPGQELIPVTHLGAFE